jgi:hypothetical protein
MGIQSIRSAEAEDRARCLDAALRPVQYPGVADAVLELENGLIRWEGPMHGVLDDAELRRAYLSV